MTPSLGSINLPEQLPELRETGDQHINAVKDAGEERDGEVWEGLEHRSFCPRGGGGVTLSEPHMTGSYGDFTM